MSQLLKPGQILRTASSQMPCTVTHFLGGGGQGEVYQADLKGQAVALKWYRPDYLPYDPTLRTRLETAIQLGPPSDTFLWPIELVVIPRQSGYGYIMPLRGREYQGMAALMSGRLNPTFYALTTAGLHLANSFLQLHSKGLCYRDISWGNIFLQPDTGEVLICDNDNVSIEGDRETAIWGTPGFTAPEIMRQEALPSRETDLYSLAVLLFQMFMVHHPLEGRREAGVACLDGAARYKLYGEEPIFIFDPNNESNRPLSGDPNYANPLLYWPIYPQFLRDRFIQAFTAGLRDPGQRVTEGIWRATMVRLRDMSFRCPGCRCENFFDPDPKPPVSAQCWNCQLALPNPPRLRIGKHLIVLTPETRLFPHHVDEQRPYDFSQPIATMNRHPERDVWGLKNCSSRSWQVTMIDQTLLECPPGRTVQLQTGIRIQFSKLEGIIQT